MASAEFEKTMSLFPPPGQADADDPTLVVREKMHAIHPTRCSDDTEVARVTLGGVPAVLIAAFLVKALDVTTLRWLVAAVVLYTALVMIRSAVRDEA